MSSIPVQAGFGHDVTLVYPFSGCDSIDLEADPVVEVSNKDIATITRRKADKEHKCFSFSVDHNGAVGDVTVTVSITRLEGKVKRLTVWSQVFSMLSPVGDNVVRLDISAARPSPVIEIPEEEPSPFPHQPPHQHSKSVKFSKP